MKKSFSILLMLFSLFILTSCFGKKESAVDFVNRSNITSYKLLDDNTNPHYSDEDLTKVEFDNGYDLKTLDGSINNRFIQIDEYGPNPVMTYFSVRDPNQEYYGTLFGIHIGTPTFINSNEVLNIKKQYLINDYLEENGFERNFTRNYSNRSYSNLDDNLVNWDYFIKDDVFINYAVEVKDSRNLVAFEVGLVIDELEDYMLTRNEKYEITVTEGKELIDFYDFGDGYTREYSVGTLVKIKLKKPPKEGPVFMYVDNQLITTSILDNYLLFYMEAKNYNISLRQ